MSAEAARLLRELVEACDEFDSEVNFWMSDDAWITLCAVREKCEDAKRRGYLGEDARLEASRPPEVTG